MITEALPPETAGSGPPEARGEGSSQTAARVAERGHAPVIFFDGVCGLCSRWVDFVVRWDKRGEFRFSPLQGETARDWLNVDPDGPLNSVVLVDEQGTYSKSDAIWRMLVRLGGRWTLAGWLLRWTPRPIRNLGYDMVARYRYRWFGRKSACRMPTREERARFLP